MVPACRYRKRKHAIKPYNALFQKSHTPPPAMEHQICGAAITGDFTLTAFAKSSYKYGIWFLARKIKASLICSKNGTDREVFIGFIYSSTSLTPPYIPA